MATRRTFDNLSAEKRSRITEVALEEFGQKGFDAASINRMVGRLGIAKGSMFQYFGDKQGLFRHVFHAATARVKDYLRAVRDETRDEGLFVRLEGTLLAGIRFVREHPRIYALYLRVLFDSRVPFRDELLDSLRSNSQRFLRQLVVSAAERGELRPGVDPDRVCFLLDAIMDRFLQSLCVPHLDGGLGVYGCDESAARRWAGDLMEIVRLGVGSETAPTAGSA